MHSGSGKVDLDKRSILKCAELSMIMESGNEALRDIKEKINDRVEPVYIDDELVCIIVDTPDRIHVAFHDGGSNEGLFDLNSPMSRMKFGDCWVHTGFRSIYNKVSSRISSIITSLEHNHPITLSGFSIGAALATIGAADLPHSFIVDQLCTFGSPRVGDIKLGEYIGSLGINVSRFVNLMDPVSLFPFWGYKHVSDMILLKGAELSDGAARLKRNLMQLGMITKIAWHDSIEVPELEHNMAIYKSNIHNMLDGAG